MHYVAQYDIRRQGFQVPGVEDGPAEPPQPFQLEVPVLVEALHRVRLTLFRLRKIFIDHSLVTNVPPKVDLSSALRSLKCRRGNLLHLVGVHGDPGVGHSPRVHVHGAAVLFECLQVLRHGHPLGVSVGDRHVLDLGPKQVKVVW